MRKHIFFLFVAISCFMQMQAGLPKVWDLTLNKSSMVLYVGQSETLVPSYMTTLSSVSFTWKSSSTYVATVDQNGRVTAQSPGTTRVTCSYSDGETTVSATCDVEVRAYVSSITFDRSSVTLSVGKSTTVTATVSPYNAYNKTLSWSSSNSSVATVDSNGKITGLRAGYATITARATDGSNCSASLSVEVTPVYVTNIILSYSSWSLSVGESFTITATIYPSGATNKTLSWSSSNNGVATVDSNGRVTARATGSTTITARATDGSDCSCSCQVTVKPTLVSSLTLYPTNLSLKIGDTYQLNAYVSPGDANNQTLAWSSANDGIAKVDSNGKVTAISAGTATITAKTTDGSNLKATCQVVVQNQQITSLSLSPNQVVLYRQGNNTPKADVMSVIYPQNATTQYLNWEIADNSIASLWVNVAHTKASVWGSSNGTTVVTARTTDGSNLSATCTVTVKTLASGIRLNRETMVMAVGGTDYLLATVLPNTTSDKSVTWRSSSPAVATVSGDGTITARSVGTTIITATTADGSNLSASCTVTVKAEDYSGVFVQNGFKFTVLGAGACKLTSIAQKMTGTVSIPSTATYNGMTLNVVEIESFASREGYDEELSQGVTSIIIPSTVKQIDNGAFGVYLDNLRSVTIPSSVTRIGTNAFAGETSLQEVHITDLAAWCNIDFSPSWTDSEEGTTWFSNPLRYAHNLYVNGTRAARLVIPEGVTELKEGCFFGCNATAVQLPSTLRKIGACAFRTCTNLTEVTLPDNLETVEQGAFDGCENLQRVNIGRGIKRIEYGAFHLCTKLSQVHVADLKAWSEVNIARPVVLYREFVGFGVYGAGNGNPVMMAQGLYHNGSEVIDLKIPQGTRHVGQFVYANCKHIKSVTIPNSVTDVLELAFTGCSSLQKVYVGSGIEYLGFEDTSRPFMTGKPGYVGEVFADCMFLSEFHILRATPPYTQSETFDDCPVQYCTLYVPRGAKGNYEAIYTWSRFGRIIEEESAIDNLHEDNLQVAVKDGTIVLDGAGDSPVEVFDLSGRIVYSGHARSIPITTPGIYLIRLNGHTTKVRL